MKDFDDRSVLTGFYPKIKLNVLQIQYAASFELKID